MLRSVFLPSKKRSVAISDVPGPIPGTPARQGDIRRSKKRATIHDTPLNANEIRRLKGFGLAITPETSRATKQLSAASNYALIDTLENERACTRAQGGSL